MEGLHKKNKLLYDAVRFMVVKLQGLKDFCKTDCACAMCSFKFRCIVSLDRCVLRMRATDAENVSFLSVSSSLPTGINHSVLLQ